MTEKILAIGDEGRKVHVLIGCAMRLYVLEDEEGTQMTLDQDEIKDLVEIFRKYEVVE